MMKITNSKMKSILVGEQKTFPKYTTQLLNLANQNSQGTRPTVVGQLSELITECPYNTYTEWKDGYTEKMPNAIDDSFHRIKPMIEHLKNAIHQIDDHLIRSWIEDLVFEKTFIGFKFQEAILKKISEMTHKPYTPSTPTEESQGIDGYINGTPSSIKLHTCKTKKSLMETIDVCIIYYEKGKDGMKVDISDIEHLLE